MKTRIVASLVGALMVAIASFGGSAVAGTSTNPNITDPAGDANGVSVLSSGLVEQDTRPASVPSADLRAVWFETSYESDVSRDPETGRVLRVEYVPTGVRMHIRTEAPVHPTPQGLVVLYHVSGWMSSTLQRFVLRATPGQTADTAKFYTCVSGQCSATSGSVSYEAAIATLSFSYVDPAVARELSVGKQLPRPEAVTYTPGLVPPPDDLPRTGYTASIDSTLLSRTQTFTVGSDVPPDVDCTSTPDHPECAA